MKSVFKAPKASAAAEAASAAACSSSLSSTTSSSVCGFGVCISITIVELFSSLSGATEVTTGVCYSFTIYSQLKFSQLARRKFPLNFSSSSVSTLIEGWVSIVYKKSDGIGI